MGNTWNNPTVYAQEALRHLQNNCVMGSLVYRGYTEEFSQQVNGHKKGGVISIDAPYYFRVKDGMAVDKVDILSRSTTFTLSFWKHVAWALTAAEMTYNFDTFSEKVLKPAAQAIANYIDYTLLGLYTSIPNQVGTPGVTPSTFLTFAEAGAVLTDEAAPLDGRSCVIDPWSQAYLSDHLKGLFHQPIVGGVIEKGKFGSIAGFDMFTSQNVRTHTCGTWADGTNLVDDTVADNDTNFNMDQNGAGAAYTMKAGDIFTVASVYGVNPASGDSTGRLRQFVITTDTLYADSGGGNMEVTPAIYPGTAPHNLIKNTAAETYLPYANMDALPANNAAITPVGTNGELYKVNLAFHRDCLGLCMVPIEIPVSAPWKGQASENGYTIQCVRYFDGDSYTETIRFDVLFGVKVLNPFLGCRIAGA